MFDTDLVCFGFSFGPREDLSQRFVFGVLFIVLLALFLSIKAAYFHLSRREDIGWDIDFRLRNVSVVLVAFSAAIYFSHQYVCLCGVIECNLWSNLFSELNARSIFIGVGVVSLMALSFYIKHAIFDDSDDDGSDEGGGSR